MPALRQICSLINANLSATTFSTQVFQNAKYDEVADIQFEEADNVRLGRPVITDDNGELHDLAIDDRYSLQVYHRNPSLYYEDDPNEDFGDEGNTTKETAEMLLICMGDSGRLLIKEQDVAAGIWANFIRKLTHSQLSTLQLQGCSIIPGDVNVMADQVFAQEYPGVKFNLKPNEFMISLKYKIVTLFNKNCYSLCN